ncbi:MAG: hypothetical protein ACTTKH_03710 [Treponema sp.]
MKKTMFKFLFKLILLLVISAVIFFIGYVQFKVPLGKYGVIISKSSGYYEKLISYDELTWKWECLIPKNAVVLTFDLSPITIEKNLEGMLENGERYSKVLANGAVFAWKASTKFKVHIRHDKLIETIKANNIREQEELEHYINERVEGIITNSIDETIAYYQEHSDEYTIENFKSKCKKKFEESAFTLVKLEVLSLQFTSPDFKTYTIAREVYIENANIKKAIIEEKIEKLKSLKETLQNILKTVTESIEELSAQYE